MRARYDTIMVRMSVCYEFRSEWIRMQGQVSGVLEDLGQVIRIRTTIEFWLNPPGSAREEERGRRLMGYTPKLVDMVRSATGPPLE